MDVMESTPYYNTGTIAAAGIPKLQLQKIHGVGYQNNVIAGGFRPPSAQSLKRSMTQDKPLKKPQYQGVSNFDITKLYKNSIRENSRSPTTLFRSSSLNSHLTTELPKCNSAIYTVKSAKMV